MSFMIAVDHFMKNSRMPPNTTDLEHQTSGKHKLPLAISWEEAEDVYGEFVKELTEKEEKNDTKDD